MKNQKKIELLEQIEKYIKGELTQDEIDKLWMQFLQHPEWYDWFETELHLQSLIKKGKKPNFKQENKPSGSKSTRMNGYKIWIYAAAASLLLVLSLQFFSIGLDEPVESLAATELDQSYLIGADVMRSGNQPAEELNVNINSALATAYDGETLQAIEHFQNLLTQSPDLDQRLQIELNLGILLYNEGEYESARSHFTSVSEIQNAEEYQVEKSLWLLGNTLLKLSEPRASREVLNRVYHMNGRFQSLSLDLINKLDNRLGNIPPEEAPRSLGD